MVEASSLCKAYHTLSDGFTETLIMDKIVEVLLYNKTDITEYVHEA